MDHTGKIAIVPQYDLVYDVSEGWALAWVIKEDSEVGSSVTKRS